ncbi:MAG: type II toxin-antitoxin system VapC family toxin [Acidipropionibacterium sp.]|nr:type II toxin-antitoxin system VapC family toxin [Acidipropionibacterium sp.]
MNSVPDAGPDLDDPVILDTNVVSELVRPRPDRQVVEYLKTVSERSFITSVVLGELHLGVELCPDGRRKRELARFVDSVRESYSTRTIPFTVEAARNYATAVARLQRSGIAIGVNDAYIAATAVTTGAVLCTRNTKDFERYPGIRLHNPWA